MLNRGRTSICSRFAALLAGIAIIGAAGETRAALFIGYGPGPGNYPSPTVTGANSETDGTTPFFGGTGISFSGPYSIVAGGDGFNGDVTLTIQISNTFDAIPSGVYDIGTSIDSFFSVTGGSATLTDFSITMDSGVPGSTATASAGPLPVGLSETPIELFASGFSSLVSLTFGTTYTLESTTTITFTGVTDGATLLIDLPGGGNIDPASVPEPGTFALLGLGSVLVGGAAWRRKRKLAVKSSANYPTA